MATKIMFRSAYDKKERSISKPGSRWRKTYAYDIDPLTGKKELKETGQENIYEKIQAYAEDCKLENMLAAVKNGDYSKLRPDGIYQDVSEIPTNLIDAKKQILKMENFFNNLPNDIKSKYDNDINVFMKEAGSEAWMIDTGMIQPIKPEEQPNLKVETTVDTPKPKE